MKNRTYTYKDVVNAYVLWYIAQTRWHEDFKTYYDALMAALEQLFGVCMTDKKQRVDKTRLAEQYNAVPYDPNNLSDQLALLQAIENSSTLWSLFDDTAEFLHRANVGSGWLMGGPYTALLAFKAQNEQANLVRNLWDDAAQQFRMVQNTYRQMLYELFVLLFGRIETVVTSADLLALGVDDSHEPDLLDYL
jgi:hypothetical protein